MIKNLFVRYPATLPSGLSGSRLPHNMVWHRTRVRATMNGPQHMLFACRRQIIWQKNDAALEGPSHRPTPVYLANLTPFLRVSSELN